MRRTIPLLITAAGGFVLIVAFFIPATEGWGEVAAIWFDILAAIAFILGGGNLLKVHLKKVSDRAAGWGYSGVTLVAFVATLYVGLFKVGAPPAPQQEFYGETFAPLALADFPLTYSVPGRLPARESGTRLADSVIRQLRENPENGTIEFRGWMSRDQFQDLTGYKEQLQWQCAVEKLFAAAQPPAALSGKVTYHADREMLGFVGTMTDEDRRHLLSLDDRPPWTRAVDHLYKVSTTVGEVPCDSTILPDGFDEARAKDLSDQIQLNVQRGTLAISGPMSSGLRDKLSSQYAMAMPLANDARARLVDQLKRRGAMTAEQEAALVKVLDTTWKFDQLRSVLDQAGMARQQEKTAGEMLEEREAGATDIDPKKVVGEDQPLNSRQVDVLREFVDGGNGSVDRLKQLTQDLQTAGPWNNEQALALQTFIRKNPTDADRKKEIFLAMVRSGPVTDEQRTYLLRDYRHRLGWRNKVGELFVKAHTVKYPWSGEYRAQGAPFWWLYEYAFKPLTATMFAMLAFYVASAAFRAFRAKNAGAILLLGTAFLILLGRTAAGVVFTSWLPETGLLSYLRTENLTVTIMSVFNTAGNRAIMIGIALGIASTSLKVLLGIDRSYLGSGED